MQETKECRCCGREFFKRKRDSQKQWEERNFCSISCKNKSVEPTPIHIRFWSFVDKKRDNDCWLWLGSKDENGYGRLATQQGKSGIKAHRLSYELRNGAIPKGMFVCHKCDNPSCVNPSHLFIGTQKDNMQDCSMKNRINPKSFKNLIAGKRGYLGAAIERNKV